MNLFKRKNKTDNVLDDTFIRLIQVAMEDNDIKNRLISILSLEKEKRNFALKMWLQEMRFRKAPEDFITSISYFQEDDVAERALKIFTGKEKIK